MAKKTEINIDNSDNIYRFFRDRCELFEAEKILSDGENYRPAKAALDGVERITYTSLYAKGRTDFEGKKGIETTYRDPEQLQSWIDLYVNEKGWQRCLNNLRQQRHKRNKQMKGNADHFIKVDQATFTNVSIYAEKAGQTKKEFLAQLMRDYVDRFYENS